MTSSTSRLLIASGAALVLVGLASQLPSAQAGRPWTLNVESVTSPAGDNSAEPQLTVEGSRAILSWIERSGVRTTVKFSERTATGWSQPRVVIAGENLMVNASDIPSVRVLGDGSLAAQWLQESGGDPEAYDLRVSWSKDGTTWAPAVSPHHDGTKTQHGFASLFQAPKAGLGLVWLDGRRTNPEEEGAAFGNMQLRATVFGTDGKQGIETAVDTRVCDCCPTAVAATSTGVIVAYRNRSAAEIRDIYVTRFEAGKWSLPTPVHNDGWKITGCPVNGPAISAHDKDVVVAWFTTVKGEGHVFAAFSHNTGRTFSQPVRVDDAGALGRAGVELLSDGSAVVSWVEAPESPKLSQLKVRRVEEAGGRSAATGLADATGTRIPRMARVGDELLFAWTETKEGSSQVRTSRAAIPR